eukprot:212351_1
MTSKVKTYVKHQSLTISGFIRELTDWMVPDVLISIITIYTITEYSVPQEIKLKDTKNDGKSLGLDRFYDKDSDGKWSFVMVHVYAHAIFDLVLMRYISDMPSQARMALQKMNSSVSTKGKTVTKTLIILRQIKKWRRPISVCLKHGKDWIQIVLL